MKSWYQKGLQFKCTGCGRCCSGSPGVVWVSDAEIEKISKLLGITKELFCKKYTRQIGGKLSLIERKAQGGYDCIFLKDKMCQVYEERPSQCRTFPWWDENLSSKESWNELKEYCEGVDHPDAPIVPLSEIEKNLSE